MRIATTVLGANSVQSLTRTPIVQRTRREIVSVKRNNSKQARRIVKMYPARSWCTARRESFRNEDLSSDSRIVLEARIYEVRIHTPESPNFVKYIKGCLCAATATQQRYSALPPHHVHPMFSSLFPTAGTISRVETQCALLRLFVAPHGRRHVANMVHRSFASIVNNGIVAPDAASSVDYSTLCILPCRYVGSSQKI